MLHNLTGEGAVMMTSQKWDKGRTVTCTTVKAGRDIPSWSRYSPQYQREAASHAAKFPLHTEYASPWLLQQSLHACQYSQGPPAANPWLVQDLTHTSTVDEDTSVQIHRAKRGKLRQRGRCIVIIRITLIQLASMPQVER